MKWFGLIMISCLVLLQFFTWIKSLEDREIREGEDASYEELEVHDRRVACELTLAMILFASGAYYVATVI